MNSLFFVLLLISMVLTLASLAAGIVVMGRGGKTDELYSNLLMRFRVYFQGASLVFLVLLVLTSV